MMIRAPGQDVSVNNDDSSWQESLRARDDFIQYGDNAIGLFTLALRFSLDDIHSVAAESVTDGSDDKKCDIIYIDKEDHIAVIAQCYFSDRSRQSAPANKASDLNTAIAWLLGRNINELPDRLRSGASELRAAIRDGSISRLEAWFVHNQPESKNVGSELSTVESSAKTLVSRISPGTNLAVHALELGKNEIEKLYLETLSPILVNDEVIFAIKNGFSISSGDWHAYVTAIPARRLYSLYKSHKTSLFSANVRDYLGSRNSDANINNGIKNTAESSPENFWAYNNGVTILTHRFEEFQFRKRKRLKVKGVSIVNGAQTTGAIGSLTKAPDPQALVPARFVQTQNSDLIHNIIHFNNSQNKVAASDFRSTDRIQKRLRDEISRIPSAKYEGGRRGGYKDIIERNKNLLPSYTVGQALAAFHQDPLVAYNQKSEIWIADKLYSKYFNDNTTGAHIVFCYSLLRAVEHAKKDLISRSTLEGERLTHQERDLLSYFRHRGATYLLTSAVAGSVEAFLDAYVPVLEKVSFGERTSPHQATQNWLEIVKVVSPFSQQLSDAVTDGLKSNDRAQKAIGVFRSLVQATSSANSDTYKKFRKMVLVSR